MSSSPEMEPSSSGRMVWRWRESIADNAGSSREKRTFLVSTISNAETRLSHQMAVKPTRFSNSCIETHSKPRSIALRGWRDDLYESWFGRNIFVEAIENHETLESNDIATCGMRLYWGFPITACKWGFVEPFPPWRGEDFLSMYCFRTWRQSGHLRHHRNFPRTPRMFAHRICSCSNLTLLQDVLDISFNQSGFLSCIRMYLWKLSIIWHFSHCRFLNRKIRTLVII